MLFLEAVIIENNAPISQYNIAKIRNSYSKIFPYKKETKIQ